MTKEALRPRADNEKTLVEELIDFAASVATEAIVPVGIESHVWENLKGSERFYLRMLDMESSGLKKLDNYQNFAKAFRVRDYSALMFSQKPNDARLKSAAEFKGSVFSGSEFGGTLLRGVLYALMELLPDSGSDEELAMSHLRDHLRDQYLQRRQDIIAVAKFLDSRLSRLRPEEATAARILAGRVHNEKLGR